MLSSTAIIAEILIVGVQAAAWLSVALSWTPAPLPWTAVDDGLLMITLSVALVYTLGVLIDRTADSVMEPLEKRWRRGKEDPAFGVKRLTVMHHSEGMSDFLEYIRSRKRIARATTLNAGILCVVLTLRLVWALTTGGALADWEAWLLVGASFTTILASWATRRIGHAYEKRLNEMVQVVGKGEKEAPLLDERRRRVVVTGARIRREPPRPRA